MDVRILSILFAALLFALTHYYGGAEVAGSHDEDDVAVFGRQAASIVVVSSPLPSSDAASTGEQPPAEPPSALASIGARHAALFDLQAGEILFMKGPFEPAPIASISKLMTAVLAKELFSSSTIFQLSPEDFIDGSNHPDLGTGDIITLDEALSFMLVQSDNAVARAIARTYGEEAFVRQMNEKAEEILMPRAHFVDPAGVGENLATARDLLRLAQYIMARHPDIFRITRIPSTALMLKSGKTITLRNTNLLLGTVPDIVGGKTGFTDEAGGCLLTVFVSGGRSFAAVVLGSEDRFGDTMKLIEYATALGANSRTAL